MLRENLASVTAETMDGQSIDFSDNAFDAPFSVFGLIFFPDYARGLQEMWRVLSLEGVPRWLPGVRQSGLVSSKSLWVL